MTSHADMKVFGIDPADAAHCWTCGARISKQDAYCRRCGMGQGRFVPWYYTHWGIILLTFIALGPFSLFLVWRSPLLQRQTKWIYAIVILIFTWYLFNKIYTVWRTLAALAGGLPY